MIRKRLVNFVTVPQNAVLRQLGTLFAQRNALISTLSRAFETIFAGEMRFHMATGERSPVQPVRWGVSSRKHSGNRE